jgi:phosphoribosylamine-glycine ligase
MVVVGPEDPLVKGFMTSLNDVALNIPVIGPSKWCATRGSKEFAKEF